jgi:TMEM175 potassium channel family protein
MTTSRLEAFSDGVMAVLITIMVLELRSPQGTDFAALRAIAPQMGIYALSFVIIGIYWNNHHHLFQAAERVSGAVMWANLHLLFWLSLLPFATRWLWETGAAPLPTASYGATLLLAAVAYYILVRAILASQPPDSTLAKAIGGDFKGIISVVIYAVALPLTLVSHWIAIALYASVALIWLVPDRRIESQLGQP